jgi:uncharacterized peroxidase-related enzyme
MSRIVPADPVRAEGHTKELLDAVAASLGAVPNMTRVMARSTVLDGWLGLNGALRKGAVGAANGERIALAVGEANGCSYCLSAHAYLGSQVAMLSSDELERARRFESNDPAAAAILAFAKVVFETRGAVSDKDIAAARAAGLSDAALGDIVGHVAVNILTNYFNKAFEVDIDFPVVHPHQALAA